MFKSLRRKAPLERLLYILVSAVFMAVALSYIYIFVWTLLSSLKTHTEIVLDPFSLPAEWHWSHYVEMFGIFSVGEHGFFNMLFNSIWFSVTGPFLSVFTTLTFSYACTKYQFPGAKLAYTIILIMITLPIYGNGGAVYKIYHDLGLIDSYISVITSASGFNTIFLYFRAYFKNMSNAYMEAAMMDGANDFQIYFRIMFPQAKPIFLALFLTSWLGSWNSYEGALLYYPNLPTLPVGIYKFNVEMIYRARLDILFAACIFVSIPALILFTIFNKTMTESVSVGGLKG